MRDKAARAAQEEILAAPIEDAPNRNGDTPSAPAKPQRQAQKKRRSSAKSSHKLKRKRRHEKPAVDHTGAPAPDYYDGY